MDPQAELLKVIRDARARGFQLDDRLLRREIALLVDQRQAEAMMLYWVDGIENQAAIARRMGTSQQAVSKLLRKGSTNLAARLARLALLVT